MKTLDKRQSPEMFTAISPTYDVLNRVLSLGIDTYWRRQVASFLPKKSEIRLLDLATGTGDQLITLMKKERKIISAVGLDPSEGMLRIGKNKLLKTSFQHRVKMLHGDALSIPLKDNSIDCITLSFGIRNVVDVDKALAECYRVLSPGGRLLILEFSIPENPWVQKGHFFYLNKVLPKIGKVVSSHPEAYTYLPETIQAFPHGKAFCDILSKNQFIHVTAHPLTFGVTTVYIGEK